MAINFKKLKKQIHFEKDDIGQPYWTFIPTEEQEFYPYFLFCISRRSKRMLIKRLVEYYADKPWPFRI